MNNFYGPRVVFASHIYDVKTVRRSWQERLFTLPWNPWKSVKIVRIPGMYKCGNVIYAHTSLADEISKIMNGNDDAPTLKIRI